MKLTWNKNPKKRSRVALPNILDVPSEKESNLQRSNLSAKTRRYEGNGKLLLTSFRADGLSWLLFYTFFLQLTVSSGSSGGPTWVLQFVDPRRDVWHSIIQNEFFFLHSRLADACKEIILSTGGPIIRSTRFFSVFLATEMLTLKGLRRQGRLGRLYGELYPEREFCASETTDSCTIWPSSGDDGSNAIYCNDSSHCPFQVMFWLVFYSINLLGSSSSGKKWSLNSKLCYENVGKWYQQLLSLF
ncbi:hypothetical protein Bca4012_038910 [Brassica carinata]